MTEALADAKDHNDELRVSPAALSQIIALVKGGTLSHQAAKRVFAEVAAKGGDPRTIAESLGLIQVADSNVVAGWVTDVLGAHATEVARYKKGETKLMAFLLGQVMRDVGVGEIPAARPGDHLEHPLPALALGEVHHAAKQAPVGSHAEQCG